MASPDGRRAVARTLRISVARERRLERSALRKLQAAARHRRCGSIPVWIHVPDGYRLVLVDDVLVNRPQAASSTHVSRRADGSGTREPAIGDGRASFLFTLTMANTALLSF
jgi:hypothetical protein